MAFIKATGCAFNMEEMFMNFPYKKLIMNCDTCEKITGDKHRKLLVKRIFRECVKLVLEDIIDNNVTFELPTGKKKADIHMKRVQGEAFKNLRVGGKWQDVDLLSSDFTGHELALYMYGERDPRIKTIYVNKRLKDKITKKTNDGMQYC